MKYALITQFNWGYNYGFNGLINGLDYHDNKLIDVHVICTDEIPQWYIDRLGNTFDFDVFVYKTSDYATRYKPEHVDSNRWEVEFYKYKLAGELAGKYDAIMITDCDYMVGGKLENYFRLVVNTELICTSNNAMAAYDHFNGASLDEYKKRISHDDYFFPCMNSPFISDPNQEKNQKLYERIYELGLKYAEDIVPFSRALIDCERVDDMIVLPGALWFTPEFSRLPITRTTINGKRVYLALSEKMMMMHRHWWCRGEMETDLLTSTQEGSERRKYGWENVQLLLDECKIINTEWKLPLDWPLDGANIKIDYDKIPLKDKSKTPPVTVKPRVSPAPNVVKRSPDISIEQISEEDVIKVAEHLKIVDSGGITVSLGKHNIKFATALATLCPDDPIWSVDDYTDDINPKDIYSIATNTDNVVIVIGKSTTIGKLWERPIAMLIMTQLESYENIKENFIIWTSLLTKNGYVVLRSESDASKYISEITNFGVWTVDSSFQSLVFLKRT